ncbi:type IV pilus twitching motility protein PilT [Acidithiobacillus ferrivorans]|nr:type IV pilus twitching motility protein PilT [Acidithiobacillus ferrivorans]
MTNISELLRFAVKNGASDMHVSAGMPPVLRIHGAIHRLNGDTMDSKTVRGMLYDIMNDNQRKTFEKELELDFAYDMPHVARFRVNVFNQDRGPAAAFRTIPSKVLTLEDIHAPKSFHDIISVPRGLVLVTGPTGSGKSTTLAALLDDINTNRAEHIITIEDPIEFIHQSKKCLVNQREVGSNTHTFANALRSALREDPDVILIGELRDLETMRLALTAAETGHVVFATLHTSSAPKTIDRIVDSFPGGEKEMVRAMLSESLRAVIAQVLVPTADGLGRVAGHEVMIATPAIRNLIRENKVAQMVSAIQTGQANGMQTLDQSLSALVRAHKITKDDGVRLAQNKEAFKNLCA